MPGVSQIVFGAMQLTADAVFGRRVLDVGACDFNGSIRPLIESWKPAEYIGVDIISGPGVDRVCSADDLVQEFGLEQFDIVICLEMLEHSPDWKRSISNMKRVLKPGGLLLVTTRSRGYPCHGYPHDFWRYEVADFKEIFADFETLALSRDPQEPGVFLFARKPSQFVERDLTDFALYSMLSNQPERIFTPELFRTKYCRKLALKQRVKDLAHRGFLALGRGISRVLGIHIGMVNHRGQENTKVERG